MTKFDRDKLYSVPGSLLNELDRAQYSAASILEQEKSQISPLVISGPSFLLINYTAGFIGNSPMFWEKGGSGYTPRVDEAERFTLQDAESLIKGVRSTHRMVAVPLEVIERLANCVIDIQDLDKEGDYR